MIKSFLNLFRRNKKRYPQTISPLPKHVAVIMDGNGRWANAQGMTRVAGHKRGVDSVKALIRSCVEHQIPNLSIFAFSSENWNRPRNEIDALMELMGNALETQTKKLNENGVQMRFLGDLSKFDQRIRKLVDEATEQTKHNTKLIFSIAINYGGRWDITEASRKLAEQVAQGELRPEDITEELLEAQLSTSGIPDPDLVIRTSGEFRISNFMLWQAAYSEFYFTNTLWPDFDEEAFTEALLTYTDRDRRFGNAKDKNQKSQSSEPSSKKGTQAAALEKHA